MLKIKYKKINLNAKEPKYAHEGDAGLDLYSIEDFTIKPGEGKLIKTGISIAIPKGYVGLIWDRSGLAVKDSIHVLAGVIDSCYRGEICIALKNLSNKEFIVTKEMKIAQMLIQPVESILLEEVNSLEITDRNNNGFGSTGTN